MSAPAGGETGYVSLPALGPAVGGGAGRGGAVQTPGNGGHAAGVVKAESHVAALSEQPGRVHEPDGEFEVIAGIGQRDGGGGKERLGFDMAAGGGADAELQVIGTDRGGGAPGLGRKQVIRGRGAGGFGRRCAIEAAGGEPVRQNRGGMEASEDEDSRSEEENQVGAFHAKTGTQTKPRLPSRKPGLFELSLIIVFRRCLSEMALRFHQPVEHVGSAREDGERHLDVCL
jgi:hypothetical protein